MSSNKIYTKSKQFERVNSYERIQPSPRETKPTQGSKITQKKKKKVPECVLSYEYIPNSPLEMQPTQEPNGIPTKNTEQVENIQVSEYNQSSPPELKFDETLKQEEEKQIDQAIEQEYEILDEEETEFSNQLVSTNLPVEMAQTLPNGPNVISFQIFRDKIDAEVYPKTVSKYWFDMESLKNEGKFNQEYVEFIETLQSSYQIAGWKRSRGDGNCYFRAVIHPYLCTLMKPNNDYSIEHFLHILKQESSFSGTRNHLYHQKCSVINVFSHIHLISQYNKVEAFIQFSRWMQVDSFEIEVINCFKMIIAQFLLNNTEHDDIFPYIIDGVDFVVDAILEPEREAEQLALLLAPMALGIQVVQYHFFGMVKEEVFPHIVTEGSLRVYIIMKKSGHYDILYRQQEQIEDGYDFSEGKYQLRVF